MSLENKSPILAGWCNRDERENKLLFFRVLVLAGHDRNPFPVVPAKAKTSALEDRSFVLQTATSKLQREISRLLSVYFGKYTIRENIRPEWLVFDGERVELDFYIEELSIAIEVQGEQHYRYVQIFHHTQDGFRKRVACDEFKRRACDKFGVRLYEVSSVDDFYLILEHDSAHQGDDTDFIAKLRRQNHLRGYIGSHDIQTERQKIEQKHGILVKAGRLSGNEFVDRRMYEQALNLKISNLEKRIQESRSEITKAKLKRRIDKCQSLKQNLQELHLI